MPTVHANDRVAALAEYILAAPLFDREVIWSEARHLAASAYDDSHLARAEVLAGLWSAISDLVEWATRLDEQRLMTESTSADTVIAPSTVATAVAIKAGPSLLDVVGSMTDRERIAVAAALIESCGPDADASQTDGPDLRDMWRLLALVVLQP
jgi:hypothetical protein